MTLPRPDRLLLPVTTLAALLPAQGGDSAGSAAVVPARNRVYVHEPVRFEFRCEVDSALELAQARASTGEPHYWVQFEVSWLTETGLGGAQLMEVPETTSDRTVHVVVNRKLQPADVELVRTAAGDRNRFRFFKTILPTRPGTWRLAAAKVQFQVFTSRHTDIFGSSQRGTEDHAVAAAPVTVEVLPLPAAGRPEPFFGGVGRFRIDARADRSAVDVGGSVEVVLTISGEGNMQHLRVPELTDLPGLHRVGRIEKRERDKVVVTYDLTPETAEVRSIGSIKWNYFDPTPGAERYVEIGTRPLPLAVRARAGGTSLPDLSGAGRKAVQPGVDDIFDVKLPEGSAPVRLEPAPGAFAALFWCLVPWILGVSAVFLVRARRSSLADVVGRRAKGAARAFERAVEEGRDPLDALVGYLADRLGCAPAAVIGPDLRARLVAGGIPEDLAERSRTLVDRGVAARYGGGGGVDRAAVTALVDELERGRSAGGRGRALLLLAACALAAAGAPAQDPVAAYRAGDYAAAAEGFRAAASRGDRRAEYNLGNALFRQGMFARALAAYERARLAMPRDADLLANLRLVRRRLELDPGEGEPFAATVAAIRDSFTAQERFFVGVLCNLLAAALLCFGGRRLRIPGVIAAALALVTLVEVSLLQPNRLPRGIVVEPEAALRAEPDAERAAVRRLAGGAGVEVMRGVAPAGWVQVRVDGRRGFLPASSVVVVE